MIRSIEARDIEYVRKIHEKFYKEEFDFPDFLRNFLWGFVSVDTNDDIIAAAGVRTLTEIVAVTDKDKRSRDKYTALYELLNAGVYVSKRSGHDSLHAFIQDKDWLETMKNRGWDECKGRALFIGV